MARRTAPKQFRLLCSEETVPQVEQETLRQVAATVVEIGKPVTKLQVLDALVQVAMRHPDEVSRYLIDAHAPSAGQEGVSPDE